MSFLHATMCRESAMLLLGIALLAIAPAAAHAAEPPAPVMLWPDGAPGAVGDTDDDRPCLWVYPAPRDRACGAAVVVCPGGGYRGLALDHEGHQIAHWLNELGVTAAVLRYRRAPNYRHPTPLGDAQRAMRYVRAHAQDLGVDPARIGIWGFSAGGHLASTVSTHFDDGKRDAADAIDRVGCRPDFAILAYPVITLSGEHVHGGSRRNLLGDDPPPALVENLSNHLQVTKETPPTFLFHTGSDTAVPPENSVLYYLALRRAGVPAEMHILEAGRHGVGLALNDPTLSVWPECLGTWLEQRGVLKPR